MSGGTSLASADSSVSREAKRRVPALREVRIIVAGVGDEFPGAVGHGEQQGSEGFRIERAGGEDADGAVGGGEVQLRLPLGEIQDASG